MYFRNIAEHVPSQYHLTEESNEPPYSAFRHKGGTSQINVSPFLYKAILPPILYFLLNERDNEGAFLASRTKTLYFN